MKRSWPLLTLSTFVALAGLHVAAQSGAGRVFLVGPSELLELDPATFVPGNRVPLPREAGAAGDLTVNRAGQALFSPAADDKPLWICDGRPPRPIERGARRGAGAVWATSAAAARPPLCVLSADGRALYWFQNEFRTTTPRAAAPAAPAVSVTTTFRAWRTDLLGRAPSPIASFSFPPCRCETGACEETCPEAQAWSPEGGIDDFFLVSRWIPGQIGATYQSSAVYRRAGLAWTEARLAVPLETVLDAALGGRLIVHAVNDSGCCGWMNESGDRTLLLRDGRDVPLFDEREEYANDDYDVSFYTPAAKLSPAGRAVAMTVASTWRDGDEIRLSADGKADAAELDRIRRAAADLPAVVIVTLGPGGPGRAVRIPRAELVGWLDEDRLLVARTDGTFEAWPTHASRGTRVRLPAGARVLVR